MKKDQRSQVYAMYGGRCAYCGVELLKGWHVDHKEPIRRKQIYDQKLRRWVNSREMVHPERDCIENKVPACQSCNINKHSLDLEQFRSLIYGFMKHLNELSTQYKVAKRYGLVTEDIKPIKFYFESFNP